MKPLRQLFNLDQRIRQENAKHQKDLADEQEKLAAQNAEMRASLAVPLIPQIPGRRKRA